MLYQINGSHFIEHSPVFTVDPDQIALTCSRLCCIFMYQPFPAKESLPVCSWSQLFQKSVKPLSLEYSSKGIFLLTKDLLEPTPLPHFRRISEVCVFTKEFHRGWLAICGQVPCFHFRRDKQI